MEEIGNNSANTHMGDTQSVPPPPTEVKVRTMRSDIEGVAQAGGGLPQFKTVAVEGMALPKSRIGSEDHASSKTSNNFPWWIIVLAGIVLITLIWFGYGILVKR